MKNLLKFAIFSCASCLLAVNSGGWAQDREAVAQPGAAPQNQQRFLNPAIIQIDGPIDWKRSKYFRSRIQRAKSAGVDLLIVEIDSPGGLKSESLDLAEMLRDVDWARTVAFIPRRAISGAALMSLGCDEIVVDENALIGDIGAIEFDPELFAFRFVKAKVQSVLVAQVRELAASKGRPPELAESMIDKDVLTFQRPRMGDFDYKNVRVDEQPKPSEPWLLVEESGPEKFLTVTGARAVQLDLADGIAANRDDLAKRFGLQKNQIRVFQYTTTDSIVYNLNHPVGTALLIIIGLVALYFELSAPGIGVGGLLAGLCAALFFWSRFLGGTSSTLEIILFAAGVVFLIMEIIVIPGWGLPGLIGLMLVLSSVIMASQDFVMPSTARQWNQFLTTALILCCSAVAFGIAAIYITKRIGRIPVLNQLVLAPSPDDSSVNEAPKDRATGKPIPQRHPDVSVGDWGRAESLLRPAGRALFNGRSFDVVSDGDFIEPGNQVKVIDIQGNRILVAAVEDIDLSDTVHHRAPDSPQA